jgi:hypothetical protein
MIFYGLCRSHRLVVTFNIVAIDAVLFSFLSVQPKIVVQWGSEDNIYCFSVIPKFLYLKKMKIVIIANQLFLKCKG